MDVSLLIWVAKDSGLPDDVSDELRSFSEPSRASNERSVYIDIITNAIGGIASGAVWQLLPLYARYLAKKRAHPDALDVKEVAAKVIDALRGLSVLGSGSEFTFEELAPGPGTSWAGTVVSGKARILFTASATGGIVSVRVT